MTFEKILNDLSLNKMSPKDVRDKLGDKSKMKKINYYIHFSDMDNVEPLKESQLQELNAIVNILQILYNSSVDSPIEDSQYDNLQELLVNMGIPRLSGSLETSSASKVNHKYTQLRGTLNKVYYLSPNDRRTNKSRKSLDEWIKSTESLYEKNTGRSIDLNKVKIICQPKFDGASSILEVDTKLRWITRGDTKNNLASDVSHIMNIFNDRFKDESIGTGIKFEVMITEDGKDKINELFRGNDNKYKNSRQIVTASLNSNEADFKSDYLYPIPLRIIHDGDLVEHIHPELINKFPTLICTFGDRDKIREFANSNRYVVLENGERLRTDGAVLTIIDDNIKMALGRDNNINNFEVAYKFTEEVAYSKVKDIDFYVSEFSFITPVLVINDVIMKGNTISRISLSNKERFDELDFSYGDDVKILYDIIPYATIDEKCKRVKHGRKIPFTTHCPKCKEELDISKVQVQCTNPACPSRKIGRMANYCSNLLIKNVGYSTLDTLYVVGFLDNGIPDLYKLKKRRNEIELLEGFGKARTKKIINEIEVKRKLKDYEFFGSLGIQGSSIKTFEFIFSDLKLTEFINMFKMKNFDLMRAKLIQIKNIGDSTASSIIGWLKNENGRKELEKLLKEVKLQETFTANKQVYKGTIVFTGCRPSPFIKETLLKHEYKPSDTWVNSAKALIVPSLEYTSKKVNDATNMNIPIISYEELEKLLGLKEE